MEALWVKHFFVAFGHMLVRASKLSKCFYRMSCNSSILRVVSIATCQTSSGDLISSYLREEMNSTLWETIVSFGSQQWKQQASWRESQPDQSWLAFWHRVSYLMLKTWKYWKLEIRIMNNLVGEIVFMVTTSHRSGYPIRIEINMLFMTCFVRQFTWFIWCVFCKNYVCMVLSWCFGCKPILKRVALALKCQDNC